ncbi:MAG: DinB family protein [Bryobacteraceae bacterium]|nr:DinB family protein [Bryobacteraceae bacterium]
MNEPTAIADLYRAATLADSWYGPPLAELIQSLNPASASLAATPGGHSPLALLQHLLLWNERIREAVSGTPLPEWNADQDWSEPPMEWPELVGRWQVSRDKLERAMRDFPAARLTDPVPGRSYDFRMLLNGGVHHVIYHAGQLAMLKALTAHAQQPPA